MALSIKNPQTEQAARELAKMTGESITVAIQVALSERIERKRLLDDRKAGLKELLQLAQECAQVFPKGKNSTELIDELYDKETGLPL